MIIQLFCAACFGAVLVVRQSPDRDLACGNLCTVHQMTVALENSTEWRTNNVDVLLKSLLQ